MRVTRHNGRKQRNGRAFNPKHNDRNYDLDKAENLDKNQTENNLYWNCYSHGLYRDKNKQNYMSFEEAELKAYDKLFRNQYERVQEQYRKNRNKKQMKTFEEWKNANPPWETYYQIGSLKDGFPDMETLENVYALVHRKEVSRDKALGVKEPFIRLNVAFHGDEAVIQLHERKVPVYRSERGNEISLDKALEQAGYGLPFPDKPKGRYNNRSMTYDKQQRKWLLEACKECGLQIEEIPLPTHKSKDKEQWLYEESKRLEEEKKQVAVEKAANAAKAAKNAAEAQRLQLERKQLDKQKKELEEEKREFQEYVRNREKQIQIMENTSEGIQKAQEALRSPQRHREVPWDF